MTDPARLPTQVCGEPIGSRIFRDVERLTSFTEDIVAAGFRPGSRTVSLQLSHSARACALLAADEVVELLRVRTADQAAICLEHTFLPRRAWDLVRQQNLDTGSLYSLLEDHGERIVRSEELLSSRLATPEELHLLQREGPLAVVVIARVCFDDREQAIEFTENVLAADRYVFRFGLRR